MTGEQYIKSILALKPNIHYRGKKVDDLMDLGLTRTALQGIAHVYDLSLDPRYRDILTINSPLTDSRVSVFLSVNSSPEALMNRMIAARFVFHKIGVCTGGRCTGWDSINALWYTTYEMDSEFDTDYHERFKKYLTSMQKEDKVVAGALTDAKGDRALRPSHQPDKDMYVRVVKIEDDGITVRGAKAMIANAVGAHEIIVHPGSGFSERDRDYAVAFAMPGNAKGLTQILSRRPGDEFKESEGFDSGNVRFGSSESLVIMDDVFVPMDRVFMCREHDYAAELVTKFVLLHRPTLASCLSGCGDVITGAAALAAQYNGIERKMRNRLSEMTYYSEALYSSALGSCQDVLSTECGACFPNQKGANIAKLNGVWMPYEIQKLADEIAGGIVSSMPSSEDLSDPDAGTYVRKYLKGAHHTGTEERLRAIRLLESMLSGPGKISALCMHGGGSPDAARMALMALSDIGNKKEMAKRLAGID
jgi:4-hydroxybutyryl-CoA dehydratase/vinylacetyl-CoA-Delta-isomerase